MRTFLHIALGALLCFLVAAASDAVWGMAHPYGAISNHDYPRIWIVSLEGSHGGQQYELRKGESKLLPYGQYEVSIPGTKTSFILFKNNRGTCDIGSMNGLLTVATNQNASVGMKVEGEPGGTRQTTPPWPGSPQGEAGGPGQSGK
ncbi:hypothetical protein CfE428DRAFT_5693 [Chthoniobacter flavus Ellin428]|uniref:Uncharacterized protein n=1 Tax=Chthoniobacter flavus Ellin428 TaxID=497964 RepID=B4D9X6_9BACT|nr:hypothetical protein [Chthoniobacter flavus]EDY16730.1 hypothetical protein CfE428DRAFT_5693 [Chthoniobacter flavus Ellin428]TCO87847.1 hypothetical protein EV701_120146 [Chthoniobacter flavus]